MNLPRLASQGFAQEVYDILRDMRKAFDNAANTREEVAALRAHIVALTTTVDEADDELQAFIPPPPVAHEPYEPEGPDGLTAVERALAQDGHFLLAVKTMRDRYDRMHREPPDLKTCRDRVLAARDAAQRVG